MSGKGDSCDNYGEVKDILQFIYHNGAPPHVRVVKYFVFTGVPVATVNLRVRPRESPPKLAEVSRWRPFGRASASALLSRRFMKLQFFLFTFSFGKRPRLPEPIPKRRPSFFLFRVRKR